MGRRPELSPPQQSSRLHPVGLALTGVGVAGLAGLALLHRHLSRPSPEAQASQNDSQKPFVPIASTNSGASQTDTHATRHIISGLYKSIEERRNLVKFHLQIPKLDNFVATYDGQEDLCEFFASAVERLKQALKRYFEEDPRSLGCCERPIGYYQYLRL